MKIANKSKKPLFFDPQKWWTKWAASCQVVLKGKVKTARFKPGGGRPENINARAALVSGPPGIGKTTTCRLVAQLHGGYEAAENL